MSVETAVDPSVGTEVVSRVAGLSSRFRERVPETEAGRTVPRASIDELLEAGVARLLVPREHGGVQGRLGDLLELTAAAAQGCPSTGWIASLMAHNPHVVGLFPAQAQAAVWASGPDVVLAGSVGPTGKARKVDGGYRLSGRHAFTSGVNNATWVFVGAMVATDAGPPEWRLLLVDDSQYVVEDTWRTAGMRGTGSNTVTIDDVFVPEGLTMAQVDAREGTGPGAALHADPKYGLPWIAFATLGFTATMLGAAQAAYDHVRTALGTKRTPAGQRVAEGQVVQVEIGMAAAKIAAARTLLRGIADAADAGSSYSIEDRAVIGRDNTLAAILLTEAVDTLLALNGTGAFAETSPVQQAWRDIHFAASHTSVNRVEIGSRFGRIALGVAETDTMGWF